MDTPPAKPLWVPTKNSENGRETAILEVPEDYLVDFQSDAGNLV